MDLYGDYLTKVIGKGGDSNKTASDATPKSTGTACAVRARCRLAQWAGVQGGCL